MKTNLMRDLITGDFQKNHPLPDVNFKDYVQKKMLDRTVSFRVSEEIYTIFKDKYGEILPQFLRSCLEWACDTDYKTISPVFFHEY